MGLSIVVSGAIIFIALLIVLFTLFGSKDFLFLLEESSSAITNVEESISKTDMKITSIRAFSDSDVVSFDLVSDGNEKLWNYDEFDLFITYDADISGTPTRITEQLTFNPVALDDTAKLKAVQNGTMVLSGSVTVTDTLNPSVDTTKSFLIFGSNSDINRPVHSVRCRIFDSTTVECIRSSTDTSPVNVWWYVVEYSSGISVQRGVQNQNAGTMNIPITPVASTSQAFVLYSKTVSSGDGSWGSDDPIACRLTLPNNLQCIVSSSNTGHNINWEVVEFTDPNEIDVQTGTAFLRDGIEDLSTDVTITSVDTSSTFVLAGFYSSGSGTTDSGRRLMRTQLIDDTTIRFDRSLTGGGDDLNIVWQVIQLNEGSIVQLATANFPSGTAERLVNINRVNASNAVAFSGTQVGGSGQAQGRSPDGIDDIIGVTEFTFNLTSTQLNMTRQNTGASADVGWFAVEFGNCYNYNIGADEWTIPCITNDILDPGIINRQETAHIVSRLSNPIFSNGIVAIVISSDNGVVTSKSQLVT